MSDNPVDIPFLRLGSDPLRSPLILSVPHAGRDYSDALLGASRLPREKLESLEDRLVDRLIWRATANGAAAIVAQRPRAEIDLNRDQREIEPATISPQPLPQSVVQSHRTRSGLGLIPSRISGSGAIWERRLDSSELERRIAQIHIPYHEAIETLLEEALSRFGVAILLDCHSMPPGSGGEAEIVFGDRHRTSCGPEIVEAAIEATASAGLKVSMNKPYAGGYVTARHGRPARGIHALQMEIDRSLYLASDLREPGPGFDFIAHLISSVADAIIRQALGEPRAQAAE